MSTAPAAAVDDLYRDVVFDPDRWGDEALSEWMEAVGGDGTFIDRSAARSIRRAARIAVKLRRFWASSEADRYRDETSWEARVDVAVGVPAWRPGLELAERALSEDPSPEAFEDVRRRFRVVNGVEWMGGVDFDTWMASRGR